MRRLHVISLFSGAGGLSLGWKQAGLKPDLGVEIEANPVDTYRHNIGGDCLLADIASDRDEIVSEARSRTHDDLFAVIGGPPCQGFSTAGARSDGDPRNRLIFSYLAIVRELAPRWFLFENVEGLLTAGRGEAVETLVRQFAELGYTVRVEKVNFAGYGLPQARKRVLIVGNRVGMYFDMPSPTFSFEGKKHRGTGRESAPTLDDALAGLGTPVSRLDEAAPYRSPEPNSVYHATMRNGSEGCLQHVCANYDRDRDRIEALLSGQSMKDLPEALWPDSYRSRAYRRVMDGMPVERRGGAPAALRRLDPEHVSLTITSFSPRELVHPVFDRPLSLRECARLQGFPDGFEFCGGFGSVALQIGNAFPPVASRLLADWIGRLDARAGSGLSVGGTAQPGLIGYKLTEANGMSPALAEAEQRLSRLLPSALAPSLKQKQGSLFDAGDGEKSMFDAATRRLVTKARTAKPIIMKDRELGRLVSVMLRDLGHADLVPAFIDVPDASYYDIPLDWFTSDEQRPFTFDDFFLRCERQVTSFRTIFECLAELHKRRRKYDWILSAQPMPTMDQISRRGLLEYGIAEMPALTSWLMWRKWIYDIDNRSAQETGYLFEPILAHSLGGEPFGAKGSPVTRGGAGGKGRQVDCIVDADGEKIAYEFKARFTIASSGQGRFREELEFPADCQASGYKPVLMVLDDTDNEKLRQLVKTFDANGGESYLGAAVWDYIAKRSGQEIANFVTKYVREPIIQIDRHADELLSMSMSYEKVQGKSRGRVIVSVGRQSWTIEPGEASDDLIEE